MMMHSEQLRMKKGRKTGRVGGDRGMMGWEQGRRTKNESKCGQGEKKESMKLEMLG